MKRAVFKLAKSVKITSSTDQDHFVVPIDVDDWLADSPPVWDFPIDDAEPLQEPGVAISIDELDDDAAIEFRSEGFLKSLRDVLERDYLVQLMSGLSITLNNKEVEGAEVSFIENDDFAPIRSDYTDGKVEVQIIAGMAGSPPSSVEPVERESDLRWGWYVICNGRVILAADKTNVTVWGRDKFPIWHRQYSGFIGVVTFTSESPGLLPMTTTKRSVDDSSSLYRKALVQMRVPTRDWITYTNARKHKLEEAKEREKPSRSTPIGDVKARKKLRVPAEISGGESREANVLYTVPRERIKLLARAFGRANMPYKDVGLRSFDYSYDRLVDED